MCVISLSVAFPKGKVVFFLNFIIIIIIIFLMRLFGTRYTLTTCHIHMLAHT